MCGASAHTVAVPFRIPTGFTILHQHYTKLMALRYHIYLEFAKIDDDTYQVQVVSWYDNENSYTSQMVRTIKYFAEL